MLLGAMCSGAFFIPDQETFLNGTKGGLGVSIYCVFTHFVKLFQSIVQGTFDILGY